MRLRDEIVSFRLEVGDQLPPEAALMARFGVSRHSLRAAVARLEREGLLDVRQRVGTTVRDLVSSGTFELLPEVIRQAVPARARAWLEDLLEMRQAHAVRTALSYVTRGVKTPDLCHEQLFRLQTSGSVAEASRVIDMEEWLIALFCSPEGSLPRAVVAHQLRRALVAFTSEFEETELLDLRPRRFQLLFEAVDSGHAQEAAELARAAVTHYDWLYRKLLERSLRPAEAEAASG